MAVSADCRIALSAAAHVRDARAAAVVVGRKLRSVEFANGEFMGMKLKVKESKRVGAAAKSVGRRVCMSLTTNVAIGDAAVMLRTLLRSILIFYIRYGTLEFELVQICFVFIAV